MQENSIHNSAADHLTSNEDPGTARVAGPPGQGTPATHLLQGNWSKYCEPPQIDDAFKTVLPKSQRCRQGNRIGKSERIPSIPRNSDLHSNKDTCTPMNFTKNATINCGDCQHPFHFLGNGIKQDESSRMYLVSSTDIDAPPVLPLLDELLEDNDPIDDEQSARRDYATQRCTPQSSRNAPNKIFLDEEMYLFTGKSATQRSNYCALVG